MVILLPLIGRANPDGSVIYHLDPDRTQVRVHLGKSGLFGFMGDDHVIDVPVLTGTLVANPTNNEPVSLEFAIQTGRIEVLDPELAADTRIEVQQKMIGEKVLDVAQFPSIQFSSSSFKKAKGDSMWRIVGEITVKDSAAAIEISAEIQLEASAFKARGQTEIKLSAIGIKPPGAGAGTIKVKNLFTVDFESYGKK